MDENDQASEGPPITWRDVWRELIMGVVKANFLRIIRPMAVSCSRFRPYGVPTRATERHDPVVSGKAFRHVRTI
jgi:hypothetical protein